MVVSSIRWKDSSKHFAFLRKNCRSEHSLKYVFNIPTDYDMILKVFSVSKVVPLKRILSYQFVYKLFLTWSLYSSARIAILVWWSHSSNRKHFAANTYLLRIAFCKTIHQTHRTCSYNSYVTNLQLDIQQLISFLQGQNEYITVRNALIKFGLNIIIEVATLQVSLQNDYSA